MKLRLVETALTTRDDASHILKLVTFTSHIFRIYRVILCTIPLGNDHNGGYLLETSIGKAFISELVANESVSLTFAYLSKPVISEILVL